MFQSLMPKGVEHESHKGHVILSSVMFQSLMPKGVEHKPYTNKVNEKAFMFQSLMPKGVEHLSMSLSFSGVKDVSISDAERR